ncbi:AAA family ATPase [Sphingomonas sp. HDW15A]|uniref:ATP-binding domain-containing protein n=1 Tax=Sphingomonas sp. HDW15A TaxID=2714942 RepID=UPI00140B76DB|nr:ATP-binding domain-containing protein [Sphingomonas sp. HDW15A]QIK95570.1 AAA family ATPase [Sphingomonas sp. HDW15A]
MRFPSYSDLDREQRRIYGEAPGDGAILVVGPPGTGKTVMAFHRAQKLQKLGQKPHVIMFNKVLAKYTSTRSNVAPDVGVSTMHSWANSWWRAATGARIPNVADDRWTHDWNEICARALKSCHEGRAAGLSWGHLIVDEGQDFPPQMYMALGMILKQLEATGVSAQVTIFADDNQRLQADRNSRIKDIRNNLLISGTAERNFVLKKNFRNTRPIAEFARHFQVGNESGISELPDADGEHPEVIFALNDRDIADFITRKARLNPGKQVGVIVYGGKREVQRAYNQVKSRLEGVRKAPRLQMYLSKDKKHTEDALDFDSGNTITFLHCQSAKGLEFDIVFFLGMEAMSVDTSGFLNERMALYVMSSRARSELYLVFKDIDPRAGLPASSKLLPRPSSKLCRYVGLGSLDQNIGDFQDMIEANDNFHEMEAAE